MNGRVILGARLNLVERWFAELTNRRVRALPRPVRAALIRIGIGSLRGFVDAEAGELAERLTTELGQTITITAVEAWQARAADLLRIPMPDGRTGDSLEL